MISPILLQVIPDSHEVEDVNEIIRRILIAWTDQNRLYSLDEAVSVIVTLVSLGFAVSTYIWEEMKFILGFLSAITIILFWVGYKVTKILHSIEGRLFVISGFMYFALQALTLGIFGFLWILIGNWSFLLWTLTAIGFFIFLKKIHLIGHVLNTMMWAWDLIAVAPNKMNLVQEFRDLRDQIGASVDVLNSTSYIYGSIYLFSVLLVMFPQDFLFYLIAFFYYVGSALAIRKNIINNLGYWKNSLYGIVIAKHQYIRYTE